MLPDRVSNPGPLTYESGALPIALRGPAESYIELRSEIGDVWETLTFKAGLEKRTQAFDRKGY